MKLKVTWFFVAFSCAFITVSLLRLPLRADEPTSVSSTTEPYRVAGLSGTEKITTEQFKEYKITDKKAFAKDANAPATTWRSEHWIIYQNLTGRVLKSAYSVELASAAHEIRKQDQAYLFWLDLTGDENRIRCNDVMPFNGRRSVEHGILRLHEGQPVAGSGWRTNPTEEGPPFLEMGVASGKVTWTPVASKPEDETGCTDPKFPFQMVREKPLAL